MSEVQNRLKSTLVRRTEQWGAIVGMSNIDETQRSVAAFYVVRQAGRQLKRGPRDSNTNWLRVHREVGEEGSANRRDRAPG